MPRDGSGNYTLPAGNPVVSNTLISTVWANTTLGDIANALTGSIPRDGSAGPTGSFKIQDGTVAAPGLSFASEPGSGLYHPAPNTIGLSIGGTQKVQWAVAGETLFGNLNFSGTGRRITADFSNASPANRTLFQDAGAGTVTSVGAAPPAGGTTSNFSVYGSPDVANSVQGYIGAFATQVNIVSDKTGSAAFAPIVFFTSALPRARIETNGNVGVGVTSALQKLHIEDAADVRFLMSVAGTQIGQLQAVPNDMRIHALGAGTPLSLHTNGAERVRVYPSGSMTVGVEVADNAVPQHGVFLADLGGTIGYIGIGHENGVASGNLYAAFTYNGGTIGSIAQNGTAAVAFNTTSDERLKTAIIDATYDATWLMRLRPREFEFLAEPGVKHTGWIAQEHINVEPSSVTLGIGEPGDEDFRPWMLDSSTPSMMAKLVLELQASRARVDALEARLAALEAKMLP